MHWATWLAEGMRQNITWDSGWTLLGEGFATADIQVRNGNVTRTPMFYVYQMAQEFYGYDYLDNSYASGMGSITDNLGRAVQFPWTVVRVFKDAATGNLHLFVVNQSLTDSATLPGFENWNVVSWKQIKGASYSDSNPLGVSGPEPIQTKALTLPAARGPLAIAPVSVNHIVLANSSGPSPDSAPPTISITSPSNGTTVSGAAVAVSANAADNVGVAGVQFKLDGANLGAERTSAPYSANLDSTTLTNGSHTLTAVARDAAGNQTTATTSVVVSNSTSTVTPTVSITSITGTSSTITWSSTPGKTYRVTYKNDLTDATWSDLSGNITATNTITSWKDTTAGASKHRFYLLNYAVNVLN